MSDKLTKLIGSFLMTMVCVLFLGFTMTSCSNDNKEEEDPWDDFIIGMWDPMEWDTDVEIGEWGYINAPSQGGTYVFNCTNYSYVWLCEVWERTGEERGEEDQKEFYCTNHKTGDHKHLETPWGKVSIEKNIVTIQLYPNDLIQKRGYHILVSAGDIFFHFKFEQERDNLIDKWPAMEWETDADLSDKGEISVPVEGGEYVFNCTNFSNPTIWRVYEKINGGETEWYSCDDKDFYNLETPYGKISIVDNQLSVTFNPNSTPFRRAYKVKLEADGSFYTFTFNQPGKEGSSEIVSDDSISVFEGVR